MARRAIDIDKLGVDERLDLIEAIWESLSGEAEKIPVSDAHIAELDKRLSRIDGGEYTGIPWEEVLDRLRKRLK